MNPTKILCPVDFSEHSRAAVEFAASLVEGGTGVVHLLYIVEPNIAYTGAPTSYQFDESDRKDLLSRMDKLAGEVAGDDVRFEEHVIDGNPAREIVRFAEEFAIDLIVISTHGRTGLLRLLMGSVAEKVVRTAGCPVLALRQPAKSKAPMGN